MILNRSHFPWALFVLFVTAVCAVLYAANFHPDSLPVKVVLPSWFGPTPPVRNTYGGTPLGLIFGTLALAIFVFASALGIRKKRRVWKIGSVQLWLKAHIWLTILTVPLVLLHCGFRHGGPMPTVLLFLYGIVMVSGFFGLGLQQFMPRFMSATITREVVYEQIPRVKESLLASAESLRKEVGIAAQRTEPATVSVGALPHGAAAAPAQSEDAGAQVLLQFLDDECLPYLKPHRSKKSRLEEEKSAVNVFRLLKLNVSQNFWGKVDEIQQWCDDRRQIDWQLRLHHWLHGWLIIHVPFSFALLVLTFWHAYITVIYL